MRAEPPSLTIRIGDDDPLSQAMYFLDSEAQLALVLQRMLALRASPLTLRSRPAPPPSLGALQQDARLDALALPAGAPRRTASARPSDRR